MAQEIQGFYHITKLIIDYFSTREAVGQIQIGLRPQLDPNKTGVGALLLIVPGDVRTEEKYNYFQFDLILVDYVDQTDRNLRDMPNFNGIDNIQDALHTTAMELTRFQNVVTRGELSLQNFDLSSLGNLELFYDVEPNHLAGYSLNLEIGAFHGGATC